MKTISFLAAFGFTICNAFGDEPIRTPAIPRTLSPACDAMMKSWSKKYMASSPWTAQLKSNQESHTEKEFRQAVTNQGGAPKLKDKNLVQIIAVQKLLGQLADPTKAHAMMHDLANALHSWTERDSQILQRMQAHYLQKNQFDLTIIFAGEQHARDFFKAQLNPTCGFIAMPLNKDAKRFSEKWRHQQIVELEQSKVELASAITTRDTLNAEINLIKKKAANSSSIENQLLTKLDMILDMQKKIIDSHQLLVDLRTKALDDHQMKTELVADSALLDLYADHTVTPILEELLAPEPTSWNRYLIIQDSHAADVTAPFDDWPSAQCMREAGIEKINVVLEGMPASENITFSKVTSIFSTDIYPNFNAFLEAMQRLEKDGIAIELHGLE